MKIGFTLLCLLTSPLLVCCSLPGDPAEPYSPANGTAANNPIPPASTPLTEQPAADVQTIAITILADEKYQTIEGFGASAAWWAQDVGGWEDTVRHRIVELLFNRHIGIGLTIYRYNIGAGTATSIQDPWRTAESFEVSPGVYNWTRDANAIWMMKAALAEGAEKFVAFANSPPARLTISGKTNGGEGGSTNLAPEKYAEFAQYLVDVVRHLREEEGIPIGWISPLNEPQWDWSVKNGQEGCHYEPAEVLEATRALIRTINTNNLDVKVSVFESGEWKRSPDTINKLLKDPEVAPQLDHIAIHSYWSTSDDKSQVANFFNTNYPGTKIWQTEWTEMKEGLDTSMKSALVLANTIQEDLTLASVSSWQFWIAVSRYSYHDGLIYVNPMDHSMLETKRLWAMGNFSRYVRPGDVRIGVEADAAEVRVSAFQSPDAGRLVVVVIHNGSKPVSAQINGIPAGFKQVKQVETSEQRSLNEFLSSEIPAAFTFPAKSVTTLEFIP